MNIEDEFKLPKITFEKYLENPTGMKNNSVMRLSDLRSALDTRYTNLIKTKKITFKVYKLGKDKLFIHLLVPSESYDLNYDVVFQINSVDGKLKDSEFKAFSNCPSFVYTYAYTFNLRDLFITEFKDKLEKEIFLKEPTQKNFYNIISYEKSLYYAILYLLTNYENINELDRKSHKIKDIDVLKVKIKSETEKLTEYALKRKKYQYLKRHDPTFALQDKIKKEKNKTKKRLERIGIKEDKPEYVIKGKEKKTGTSKLKQKISGKPKIKGIAKKRKH